MNQVAPAPPTDVRKPAVIGYIVSAVFIGGFLLWAMLASIDSAVLASGLVKVDSSRKSIQHLEGGIVSEILVADGDRVEKGQVLVRLDQTRAGASLGVLQSGYLDAVAQQARLLAERDGLEAIAFTEDLLDGSAAKVAEITHAQTILFKARRESLIGQLSILDQQIMHLEEKIDGLLAQQKAKKDQVVSIGEELVGLNRLLDKGLIDRTRVLALQREKAGLEGEYGEFTSQIAAARTSVGEKKLEKYQIRKSFREEVVTELRSVQAEVFDYGERLLAARHVMEQTEMRAPVSGVIVGRGVHTVGGVIGPGETILELVPLNDSLIIEARVATQDIDNIRVGLDAGVRFTAFNQRETPELTGRVTYVAADVFEDERSGDVYFIARVEVPDEELQRLGESKVLQPGMMSDLMIKTGARTPADYLLEPLVVNFGKAFREH